MNDDTLEPTKWSWYRWTADREPGLAFRMLRAWIALEGSIIRAFPFLIAHTMGSGRGMVEGEVDVRIRMIFGLYTGKSEGWRRL